MWVVKMTLGDLALDRLSGKLRGLHLASDTPVYVKCNLKGELALHGGHYSVFPIQKANCDAT